MSNPNKTKNLQTICVIGHTNTGKTSLLRTLLRDGVFGDVQNASATTRHVAQVQILGENSTPLAVMFDTPGLEDATGVMDYLHEHTDARADGVERLTAFLAASEANDAALGADFSQEAKVVRALLTADIALYVIDAREPVLSKYKDELAILASSGTPILPVFNFTKNNDENMQAWREMLSRRALHISCAFDTVAFDFEAEMILWDNLAKLTNHNENLAALQAFRREKWQQLLDDGSLLIGDFLVNVASFSEQVSENSDRTPVLTLMQNAVRQGEEILHNKLAELYQFYNTPIHRDTVQIQGATQDIFDGELLTRYGIRTAGGSVTGMIIGAGIDVATLGASLGLGAALGGVIGGILPNTATLKDKALGIETLTIDDATITLLAARAQSLHHTLRHRGHASLDALQTNDNIVPWAANKLPTALKKARANPTMCSLNANYNDKQPLRRELAEAVADTLCEHLQAKDGMWVN